VDRGRVAEAAQTTAQAEAPHAALAAQPSRGAASESVTASRTFTAAGSGGYCRLSGWGVFVFTRWGRHPVGFIEWPPGTFRPLLVCARADTTNMERVFRKIKAKS